MKKLIRGILYAYFAPMTKMQRFRYELIVWYGVWWMPTRLRKLIIECWQDVVHDSKHGFPIQTWIPDTRK